MSSIVVAGEYTTVHSKAWLTPKKPQKVGRERRLKGPVKVRRNGRGLVTYDCPDDMMKAMRDEAKSLEVRYPDQESFENSEKQTGKGIWSHQLVKQIAKLNPNLFVEDSLLVPGCAAFYKILGKEKTATGASFRKGLIPEFTIFKPSTEIDSIAITYGWRTVVMRLVKSRDLRYADVLRIWGEVHHIDARGKHWNMNMREFRA
jgi:hypothetical protein